MTLDFYNFSIKKAELNGQYNFIKGLLELIKLGLPIEKALEIKGLQLKEEIEKLKPLEEYYKDKNFL